MNKLSLSLLLVGLFAVAALARTSPQIRRQFKFTPGQTYIYEYQGRQWNGVPALADQYSGILLNCDVILQAQSGSSSPVNGDEVLMKLDAVKIEQLHTQTLSHNDIRKLNAGKEQDARQLTMYREELSKPIRFTYLDGKIVRFVAAADEAEWSINIKKSILSLFQLDLTPSKIIKSQNSHYSELIADAETQLRTASEMPIVYPIYEESFGGICETLYQVDSVDNVEQREQQDTVEFNDVLNVTKTVNFKNCLTDPSISYDRHSFDVNTQTIKGRLFSSSNNKKASQASTLGSTNYYTIPEELSSKYSAGFTGQDSVASPVPVERYSYTKYNISTAPQSLVQHRQMRIPQAIDMNLIEGVYSEGKIKYEAAGDVLMSDTQQSLKLISCVPTSELARFNPELSTLIISSQEWRNKPIRQYETIQCELSAQKLKFYQAYAKLAQVQVAMKKQSNFITSPHESRSSSSELYSHKMLLPFALSASWYPVVASGQHSVEQSLEKLLNPDELTKSYESLLISIAEDVLSEDVAQSKRAGEKIVRLVNIVSFMPKYKLAEVHNRIVLSIHDSKQQTALGSFSYETNKWKVVRKLFLDSLPLAGSKQAVELIELLIESNRLKSWEIKEICEDVPANLRYPDTEIIDGFIRISQLPQVRKSRALFASCSIAVGKMIGSAYAKSHDASYRPTTYDSADELPSLLRTDEIVKQVVMEADPRRQLPVDWNSNPELQETYERLVLDEQDLIKYVKLFKQMLSKTTQYNEKVIFIETLAHMKVPHVLPILEPYLTGRLSLAQCLGNQPLDLGTEQSPLEQSSWYNYYASRPQSASSSNNNKDWSEEQSLAAEECNYMRTIAIYASAHLSRANPSKVQAMLLPVFENTYEPYQIRIAAFTTMMLTPIPEHILERIASQTWREPNKEVASFVVGAIDTLSKLTNPAMSAYKRSALKAVDSLPKQYLDTWKFSWIAGGDHFDQERQSGLNWLAEAIKSNVSSIPRAAYFNLGRTHGTSRPKYDNIIELGFTSKGLESLLKEYLAYSKQSSADTNIVASIFENLYNAKDDLVNFYREARDSVQQSVLMSVEGKNVEQQAVHDQTQNYFFMRQQPIAGVNENLNEQPAISGGRKVMMGRSKRSVNLNSRVPAYQADSSEEPKLTLFSKLFDSTSYHALDKRQMLELLEKCDEYIKMGMEELVMGGKIHYVKMLSPSNMWHMVPSQIGLPLIVTHRAPLIVSLRIDGVQNGQVTSSKLGQVLRQQITSSSTPASVTEGQNFANQFAFNLTALVHPKIMHSDFRFLFSVEQANCEAYGVQVEKSSQISLPMEVSIAYSQPKQLLSMTLEPKTPVHTVWKKEAAKTFIGELNLSGSQADRWLGQEHLIRVPSMDSQVHDLQRSQQQHVVPVQSLPSTVFEALVNNVVSKPKESRATALEILETPYKVETRYPQPLLGLELTCETVTDSEEIVRALNKKDSRGSFQLFNEEQARELDQHSKSGPFSEYLHIIDAFMNRPSVYNEMYSTLKPLNSQKAPVYRFNLALNNQVDRVQAVTGFLSNLLAFSKQPQSSRLQSLRTGSVMQEDSLRFNRIQDQLNQKPFYTIKNY